MRKIKFRGWHLKNKEMYEIHSLETTGKNDGKWEVGHWPEKGEYIWGRGCTCDEHKKEKNVEKIILMQYTGLKAKNGEIYEGDVVKHKDGLISQVKWELDGWLLGWEDSAYLYSKSPGVEIIGNIYENPELLKGGDVDG